MQFVQRLWNGRYGRMARRDLWLRTDGRTWRVQARQGDGDSKMWQRDYADEGEARAMFEAMRKRGAKAWRDLTDVTQ